MCLRYLNENISCLKLGEVYGCCETTIIKKLKNSGNEEVLIKIAKNRNDKLTGACEVCGRNKRLKRLDGVVYCEAHYKQIKTHGKIINVHVMGDKNEYEIKDDYIEVKLIGIYGEEKGKTFLSLNRLDVVKKYRFHLRGQYVALIVDGERMYLHSFLMGMRENQVIDHINRNQFDNRDENLRFCTVSENGINKGMQKNNTSGIRGVTFDKRKNKWAATISINRKTIHLGRFSDIEDAMKIRKEAEEKYFGDILYKGDEQNGPFESEL